MCVGQLCQSDSGRTIEDFGQSESGQSGSLFDNHGHLAHISQEHVLLPAAVCILWCIANCNTSLASFSTDRIDPFEDYLSETITRILDWKTHKSQLETNSVIRYQFHILRPLWAKNKFQETHRLSRPSVLVSVNEHVSWMALYFENHSTSITLPILQGVVPQFWQSLRTPLLQR